VEALGSATVVCSDKTGTLTMNEMTTRSLWAAGRIYEVTGEGYDTAGTVRPTDGERGALLRDAVLPFALCNDARLTPDNVIGDPTEVALLVLAAKAGLHAEARTHVPRTGEVPFDPAAKYMATFHTGDDGRIRTHAKGAVDILLDRCTHVLTEQGPVPLDAEHRREVTEAARRMGTQGLRVLGAATATSDQPRPEEVTGLTLTAVAGIADPPRSQVRDAVALGQAAGVTVKMITGDHADTAAAIARELGITGDVVTGTELIRMSEQDLSDRIEGIAVFARVAPEHKVTIVRALSRRGHIVAMTGDGVNDAAALRAAHIGVAMGVTGTDVAKEAADMVLTDDDFSTIVRAIREGRSIYDNIVTFVRFQLSTNIGAILTLLASVLAGLPAPLSAIQLLWINIIMDGPPAMALGIDPPRSNVMHRPPRPPGERILSARRLTAITRSGAVMATGTMAVFAAARHLTDMPTAATMAFTTFVLFQLFNALGARSEDGPVLGRHQLRNRTLWICLAAVLTLQVVAVQVPIAQGVFDTVPLNIMEWTICLATASTVLLIEHAWRAVRRPRRESSLGLARAGGA
jgi:Ca2+-transporting ATPase